MQQKNKKIFGAMAVGVLSLGMIIGIVNASGPLKDATAAEHTASCYWNHYAYKAPTDTLAGCNEYWVCCTHHQSVLEKPTVGTNLDAAAMEVSDEFLATLTEDDIRYIAPDHSAQDVVAAIEALPELKTNLGVYGNAKYQTVLDQYWKLTDEQRNRVTNASKLLEFNEYYECVTSANNYTNFNPNVVADETTSYSDSYGTYRNFVSTRSEGENWEWNLNLTANISDFSVYDYFTFAIYNEQVTDWACTNWTNYLDLINDTVCTSINEGKHTFQIGWTVVTISAANFKTLYTDHTTIFIAPYGSVDTAWGLVPGNHVAVTSVYGVKKVDDKVVNAVIAKIDALPTFNYLDGVYANAKYQDVLDAYNALTEEQKAKVTNASKLLQFNDFFECVTPASTYVVTGDAKTTVIPSENVSYDSTYGVYREFTGARTSEETFEWGIDFTTNVSDYSLYDSFTFALYNEQVTDWYIISSDWKKMLDLNTYQIVDFNANNKRTLNGWIEFTLSVENFKALMTQSGKATFGVYGCVDLNYGLKNGAKIKITNIYGVKKVGTATNSEEVMQMIDNLPSTHDVKATDLNQIVACEDAYKALTKQAKTLVTNYDELVEVRNTYNDNFSGLNLVNSDRISY